MSYVNLKAFNISIEEMNERLEWCNSCMNIIYHRYNQGAINAGYMEQLSLNNAYLYVAEVTIELVYCDQTGQRAKYTTRLDGVEVPNSKYNGGDAYRVLSLYYKVPHVLSSVENPISADTLLWKNDLYENQWLDAWCYDMNSAYSYAMLQDMPDTSQPVRYSDILKEDEIGFDLDLNLVLKGYADYIFPRMKSPFVKFVENWSKKKEKAKTSKERQSAKAILNYSIGYLQRHNNFLRAAILGWSKKFIVDLMDENSIYCNTDSIVSLTPRPDIKLGDCIGEFKLEHQGKFAFVGFNCQWKDDKICFRGIPNSWFPKDYDILTDPLPVNGNKYYFDREDVQIYARENKQYYETIEENSQNDK